jgi:hypothetical protein
MLDFFFENMPAFNSKYGIFEMLHLLQNKHDMAQGQTLTIVATKRLKVFKHLRQCQPPTKTKLVRT